MSCKSYQFINYYRRGLLIKMNILSSLIDLILERSSLLQLIFDHFISNPKYELFINSIKYIHQRLMFSLPGISLWWNGLAGVLDLTNPLARKEYLLNL